MIEVRGLTKSYGDRRAISNLNFSVKKGEVVGFLGPNGAGKSTTMKIVTGYMAPTGGSVTIGGFDIFENPIEVKSQIGYLPETPPVYLDMYVEDYLVYVARLRGAAKNELYRLAKSAMEKTGLVDVRQRLVGNLSKGFRQRVGLAQALVADPKVLILDEPTVGLDPKQVHEMRELILSLKGQHTIVLSTHILPEVQASCDRVIIISRGEIVAEDNLESLGRRMSATSQVLIRARRKNDELIQSLGRVPGVTAVSMQGAYLAANIDQSESVVEKIAQHVIDLGAGLLELRTVELDLEDIFIKLTSGENSASGGLS